MPPGLEPPDRRPAEQSSLTQEQRSERARKAAHARWDASPYDRAEQTRAARDALWQRFLDQVDPEGRLEPQVREQRAYAALQRHMSDLARLRHRNRQ